MKKTKRFCAWALAAAICIGIFPHYSLAEGAPARAQEVKMHNYVLHCVEDTGTTGGISADGTMKIELYMVNGNGAAPNIVGGSFGLRFPKWMGGANGANLRFEPVNTNIEITPLVAVDKQSPYTIKKDSYYAFSWITRDGADYKHHDSTNIKGYTMLLGTFVFSNVNQAPAKTAIGQLNWLSTDEAKPESGTAAEDPFNARIYSAETGLYQAFYLPHDAGTSNPEDATLTQTSVNFLFTPPIAWKGAMTLYSYDPKKQTTIEIAEIGEATTVKVGILKPTLWGATDKDTTDLWSGSESNKDTGIGAYFQSVNLDDTLKVGSDTEKLVAVADRDYKITFSKKGSMSITLYMKTKSTSFNEAEFRYKQNDAESFTLQTIALPCGDIDKSGKGNGRISVADANVLHGLLNGSATANFGQAAGETALSHYADLNGDGIISVADLNILLSAENFNKSASNYEQANDYGGGQ